MYVKIKKEVAKFYEDAAKNSGVNSHDLINQAAGFYLAYLMHRKEAEEIIEKLKIIQNKISQTIPNEDEIKTINTALENLQSELGAFFFPEILKEVNQIKESLKNNNITMDKLLDTLSPLQKDFSSDNQKLFESTNDKLLEVFTGEPPTLLGSFKV